MSALLHVRDVSLSHGNQMVLKPISFSLQTEKRLAIAGETGSGKTSLLKIIAGLEQPNTGKVLLNNEAVKGPADQLVPGHPHIAYLSQHFELPKFLRVEQVLEYANKLSAAKANKIFSICQIKNLLTRKTHELSGGEKQRIAIARLLIQQPTLLLLDEPYSHLDIPLKKILKQVVSDIGNKLTITCILVSHDPLDTLPWADEILVLKKGKLVQQGPPKEIYTAPKNEYVAGLFGAYTLLDSSWIKKLGIKTKEKEIFLRPEEISIIKSGKRVVSGVVTDVKYFGSFSLVEITSGEKVFFSRVNQAYSKGQVVNLIYNPTDKQHA